MRHLHLCIHLQYSHCEMKTSLRPIFANCQQIALANLVDFKPIWVHFIPILAKETPEFSDKIKAGE